MLKYVLWLSLACATLFHTSESSPAASHRQPRSIWPFSSSPQEPEVEPLIDEEHQLLLEKAGLGKTFNLSSHPLWKVHKYHGIDLKPVQIQTEIIKSPELDVRNLPTTSAVATNATAAEVEGKEQPDLSFLDDLGGMAWLLPEPKEDETFENIDEATDQIADAIRKEEEDHPGFFKKLWSKLWGSDPSPTVESITTSATETPIAIEPESTTSSSSKLSLISSIFGFGQNQPTETTETEEDTLTMYLPETQGNYVAVIVPSEHIKDQLVAKSQFLPAELIRAQPVQMPHPLPTQREPEGFREVVNTTAPRLFEPAPPANHAGQYRDAEQVPAIQVRQPVAQRPVPGSGSQAWIQSWSPNASYNVHVQGPSSGTSTNDDNENPQPAVELETPADKYQRKISGNEEQVAVTESQVQEKTVQPEVITTTATTTTTTTARTTEGIIKAVMEDVKKNGLERAREILENFNLPEGLRKKLQISKQDIDAILNNKESQEHATKRLRALQPDFDRRKEQLSYVYSSVAKQNI